MTSRAYRVGCSFNKIVNSRGERSKLMNVLIQLRKVAGHPYLFDGVEDRSLDPMGEHVITVRFSLFKQ